MIGLGRWPTGNYAKNWNSTIRTNGIYTTQNPSWKMRVLKDFEIKTDHLISARWPDLVIVNHKKTTELNWKKMHEERLVLSPCYRTEKAMEYESNGDTSCKGWTKCSQKRIDTGTGGHGKWQLIKIGQEYWEVYWRLEETWCHLNSSCPVGWGCRIHRLLLCKKVDHPQRVS